MEKKKKAGSIPGQPRRFLQPITPHKERCEYVCMLITCSKIKDQPGNKVASPARGQLNREIEYFPLLVAPDNSVSRDRFVRGT